MLFRLDLISWAAHDDSMSMETPGGCSCFDRIDVFLLCFFLSLRFIFHGYSSSLPRVNINLLLPLFVTCSSPDIRTIFTPYMALTLRAFHLSFTLEELHSKCQLSILWPIVRTSPTRQAIQLEVTSLRQSDTISRHGGFRADLAILKFTGSAKRNSQAADSME